MTAPTLYERRNRWNARPRYPGRWWASLALVLAGVWWLVGNLGFGQYEPASPNSIGAPVTLIVIGLFLLVPRNNGRGTSEE